MISDEVPSGSRRRLFILALVAGAGCTGETFVATYQDAGGSPDASSSDGAPGDAGDAADAAGDAGDSGGPDAASCPSAHGPMVLVTPGFCIDATEVTRDAYQAFLAATNAQLTAQPPSCSWNVDLKPSELPQAGDSRPIVDVDWCDAYAYCAWAGKRLCGRIGGGPVPDDNSDRVNAALDQWYSACSMNGTRTYPYGSNYQARICNDNAADAGGPVAVGTFPGCVGGYSGLVDMSGNVNEWEDSCKGDAGASDPCVWRGGSYWSLNDVSILACTWQQGLARNGRSPDLGFRCCSP